MTEQLRPSNRHEVVAEHHADHERHARLEQLEATGKAQEHQLRASTEQIRESVESQAISGAEFNQAERHKQPAHQNHQTVTRELRAMTFRRALVRLQKRETLTDRTLSKFIHQGPVDAASEALSKTIARPSGLIGGGLFSLIGTSIVLYTARHYGFRFNYLVFACLFALGLLIGTLCEGLITLIRSRRN